MMRKRVIVHCGCLCAIALCTQACGGKGDSPSRVDTSPTARPGATGAAADGACGVDARTPLTGDGIGELRVGVPVEVVARTCRVVRDTTALGIEGQPERTILVDLGRDSVRAVVTSGRVWRLHVAGETFRTRDALGVGTRAGALLQRPGAHILTGEGGVFVTLPSHCGVSFRLRGVPPGAARKVAQIPDSAVVSEVLAFGC